MGYDLNPLLVTGASGYLGGRIIDQLRRQDVPVIPLSSKKKSGFEDCDLTDEGPICKLIRKHDVKTVIHCAAIVPKSLSDYTNQEASISNLRMIRNLIAAEPSRIIFSSSMTVYREDSKSPIKEEEVDIPTTAYAKGKRLGELTLLDSSSVQVVILRLPGLFGLPRTGGLLYNTALALEKGEVPQIPVSPPLWSALHVDDAADICIRAAFHNPKRSIVLNVGYPGIFSTTSAINTIASMFCKSSITHQKAPECELDLSRLSEEFGIPNQSFLVRLTDFVSVIRQTQRISST